MYELLIAILVCILSSAFCYQIGKDAERLAWTKDCQQIGAHRDEGLIFKCEVQKGAP